MNVSYRLRKKRITKYEVEKAKNDQKVVNLKKYIFLIKSFLIPIPLYKCLIQCSCDANGFLQVYRDQDYAICFLKSLNEKFNVTKSQTILMTHLPDIDTVFSMVIQQGREISFPLLDLPPPDASGQSSTFASF